MLPVFLLNFIFLQEYQQDIQNFSISLITFLAIYIIVSNTLVVAKPNRVNKIYWFAALGLICFLIVTLYTDQATTFPKTIMRTYKLGNMEALSIVLNKQSCININKSIKFHLAQIPDTNKVRQFPIENNSCIIPNINILSRLGKESYIEIRIKTKEKKRKELMAFRTLIPTSSIIQYNIIKFKQTTD